jgi:signal peptidase
MNSSESAVIAKERPSVVYRAMSVIGTIICILLLPILIVNMTLIVKSFINQDEIPSVGGYMPLIVLTDSMYPAIEGGDLVICHEEDPESVVAGDIIAFYDPASNDDSVVTHRVIEVTTQDGELAFTTKGDANNAADSTPVPAANLVGVYRNKIPGAGNVAMFMQTTRGLLVCVVLPLALLVAYDIIRRRFYEKSTRKDTEALLAELEALKAAQNAQSE